MTRGRRFKFGADLRSVLAERDFRKLFGTRLVAQTGDGIITAAVGTYVLLGGAISSYVASTVGALIALLP